MSFGLPRALPDSNQPARRRSHQVREILLTALHFGRFKPGDRAPSVRRMAVMTGLNRKTIHRAYKELAEEGMLRVQWGSGTFFTEDAWPTAERVSPNELLSAVATFREQAARLGFGARDYSRFLSQFLGEGAIRARLGICECNEEQIGLIRRETEHALGRTTRRIDLNAWREDPSHVRQVDAIVTTDCHRNEVCDLAGPLGIPVYRIALSKDFTRNLVKQAERRPLLIVVSDDRYGPIFRRMLERLGVAESTLRNLHVVSAREAVGEAMRMMGRGAVYVSPLVADRTRDHDAIAAVHRCGLVDVDPGNYLSDVSMERLRAQVSLLELESVED